MRAADRRHRGAPCAAPADLSETAPVARRRAQRLYAALLRHGHGRDGTQALLLALEDVDKVGGWAGWVGPRPWEQARGTG